ncbi:MAG TPA: hypothetical protein VFU00_07850 [Gemmatimonadales bacterium]|nr:hypothetical protein [Gemmatimonadales bacterium]
MRIRGQSLVFLLAFAGCRERDQPFDGGASARDSAGVTIVMNRQPVWHPDSAWRLGPEPVLEIGGGDGPGFGEIVGLIRTPAGAIAAADAGGQVIRVFAPDGRLVRTVGRQGTGAGEFQALSWLSHAGDSLLAFDLLSRRVTLFGAAGRVRSVQLEGRGPELAAPIGRFEDGTLLVATGGARFPFAGEEGTARRDSALLLRYASRGAVADTVAQVAWGETFGVGIASGAGRFVAPMPRPFGRRSSVLLVGDEIVVADAERYELDVLDTEGRPVRSIRRERGLIPVTPEAIAAYRGALDRSAGSRGLQMQLDSALRSALDSAPYPAVMPAYEQVIADDEGNLWVLDYSVRLDQPRRWSVFSREGRWLGDVITPVGFRVTDIGLDWVLGVWRGPDGEDRIRMYQVIRIESRPVEGVPGR